MNRLRLIFILDVLSAVAAAGAAAFWLVSAGMDIPTEIRITSDRNGWQPIVDALREQVSWCSYGAVYAAVATALQAAAIISRLAR